MSQDFRRALNFSPKFGGGQTIAATTTSASVSVDATLPEVYIFNESSVTIFVRWGVGAQTAVNTDMAIPAGSAQVFSKGLADTVAAITASSTANVRVMPGFGQ